jgi:uncharacterized membrane protein HdeD (DUF308 family)
MDTSLRSALRHDLDALRAEGPWLIALGVALIVLSSIILLSATGTIVATGAAILTLGVLMIVGGLMQAVGAFWAREWSGVFLQVLTAILYIVLGVMFLRHPGATAVAFTALLAGILMAAGLFRVVASLMYRFPNWGWSLLSGAVTLLLGILIAAEWPVSGLFVIGTFLGIEMLFNGWFWVALGMRLRQIPKARSAEPTQTTA